MTALQLATMQQILSLQMEGLKANQTVGENLTFDLKKIFTLADGKPLVILKQTNEPRTKDVESVSVSSLGKR